MSKAPEPATAAGSLPKEGEAPGGRGFLGALLRYRDAAHDRSPAEMPTAPPESELGGMGMDPGDAARRGGWLGRLSGVYSAAERQLARGAKALQKLGGVPAGGLHDLEEARARLEQATARLRGADRLAALRRYAAALAEPPGEPRDGGGAQTLLVAQPASPMARGAGAAEEEDWQQLSAVPAAAGGGARPAMFVGRQGPEEAAEPMTFRELFLHSAALENLVAGYAQEPPGSQEEEELLAALLRGALPASLAPASDELLAAILSLAGAHAQCAAAGVPQAQVAAVQAHVMRAVGSLKQQAELAVVERKMGCLRGEVAEQAAAAALLHKFSSGESLPAGPATHQRLLQGLAATQEVMQLAGGLCKLAGERSGLATDGPAGPHAALLAAVDARLAELGTAASEADLKLEDNAEQRRESQAFRDMRLQEMAGGTGETGAEIAALQAERAGLLAQLERVELALTRAQAKKADLEERRSVFEEGNSFTAEALQHEADELGRQQAAFASEMAAVGECRRLLLRSQAAHHQMQEAELGGARTAVEEAAQDFAHAAARHLYFQRAQLQLLLRQLHFCARELSGIAAKQQQLASLGMDRLLPDAWQQQRQLQAQYMQAEAAAGFHLAQVSRVQAAVAAVAGEAAAAVTSVAARLSAGPGRKGLAVRSGELDELFQCCEKQRQELAGLPRPEGLPAPGDPLPPLPEDAASEAEGSGSVSGSANSASTRSAPAAAGSAPSQQPQQAAQPQQLAQPGADDPQTSAAASSAADLGLEELLEDMGASGRSGESESRAADAESRAADAESRVAEARDPHPQIPPADRGPAPGDAAAAEAEHAAEPHEASAGKAEQ